MKTNNGTNINKESRLPRFSFSTLEIARNFSNKAWETTETSLMIAEWSGRYLVGTHREISNAARILKANITK
jgi:hypothetical protein